MALNVFKPSSLPLLHVTTNHSGAADSYAKAEEMAHALVLSGTVLHFQNVVYLRPLEVAEMVFRVSATPLSVCLSSLLSSLYLLLMHCQPCDRYTQPPDFIEWVCVLYVSSCTCHGQHHTRNHTWSPPGA